MITSWIGLILGLAGVVLGQLLEGGHMDQLLQPTAALIVFGGTVGATMLSSNLEEFSHAIRSLGKVFFTPKHDFNPLVKEIVTMANVARRDGILQLERYIKEIRNPFFQSNLRHLVDGYDPNILKEMMEERIQLEEEEYDAIAAVWMTAGGFSPTIGIIGAVLGLIHVMSNLSDSSKLGAGIAVAFVATVYGVGSANLVFIPLANKMKKIFKHHTLELRLIYTGILAIQSGHNPRVIEERLYSMLGEYSVPQTGGLGGTERRAA